MAIYKLEDLLFLNSLKNGESFNFIDAECISKNKVKKYSNQPANFAPKNSIVFVKDGSVGLMKFIDFDS